MFKIYLGKNYKIIGELLYKINYNCNQRPYMSTEPLIFIDLKNKIANYETDIEIFSKSDEKEINSEELINILKKQLYTLLYKMLCNKKVFLKNKSKEVLEILLNIGCKIDMDIYEEEALFIRIDKNGYVYKINIANEFYTIEEEEIKVETILYYKDY